MCDCFPQTGGSIPIQEECIARTGVSEYATNFKQWCEPVKSLPFSPTFNDPTGSVWKPRYSFSRGPRFGVPPYCDCTPPPERFRFNTTYSNDYNEQIHCSPNYRRDLRIPGVKPQHSIVLPPQYLCPFTTDTTYARAFDMPQRHFNAVCSQQEPCTGGCGDTCEESCESPCIELRFEQGKPQRQPRPRMTKDQLIKPGTDTSNCPKCPRDIPCCPCPDISKTCDACCGCEYPYKMHMAAVTPTRKYPIVLNTPRYIPDPNVKPKRPKLLCAGGTIDCPLQSQFPTRQAIAQAKQRFLEKMEEERCKFPPECIESTYRATFKIPPLTDAPKYCSKEMLEESRRAEEIVARQGLPPKCLPSYCVTHGGKPADPRPMFDHLSTYEADFIWNVPERLKLLGGEIPCKFDLKPLCCPGVVHACTLLKQRTEEKERWGESWEHIPPP